MLNERVLETLISWSVGKFLYSLYLISSGWSMTYRQCPAYGVQAEFLGHGGGEFAGLVEQNAAVAAQLAAAGGDRGGRARAVPAPDR